MVSIFNQAINEAYKFSNFDLVLFFKSECAVGHDTELFCVCISIVGVPEKVLENPKII